MGPLGVKMTRKLQSELHVTVALRKPFDLYYFAEILSGISFDKTLKKNPPCNKNIASFLDTCLF